MKKLAVVGCALAILLAVGGVLARHYSASSQSAYALKVNGQTISPSSMATRIAIARGVATASARVVGTAAVADTSDSALTQVIVTQTLELQEAQRRGITCTTQESNGQLATFAAEDEAAGQPDAIIQIAAGLGIVPLSYLDETPSARTPSAPTVIAAYLADPRIASNTNECVIGKLFAQVRTQAGGGSKGEQGIRALQQQLRASASIDGPALTPLTQPNTPTP